MTNREMLSAMNNRELAIWLNDLSYKKICCICKYRGICRDIKDGCFNGVAKWLESEGICNGISSKSLKCLESEVDYSGILR